ncbi:uncharacterized protein CcaverHIS019_0510300 [Cutaneotrichosporon cavernicola]|uniref:DUF726-domain-containing protein n=1 Tax=Cutaneotrichosporon cavernicola TaxID=279322 RepID=A0AA48L7I6_9TREE|nr:uncharacterized protein CcaverHIS019_0510300 [Cutaneotrichosporon cavernicola]BEI93402.1 hypothetical protein CcaverHIS019_0510300 [Cutaneotrichosporon cavernicola]BEJ01180.1 hypothetical protein CcaverHIS631_0510370 [Cutaneotrichosporon cavernicola]BEJ08948.1 hypothetical protein CcaverHIS641_0510420 [Cutaneotrichosporon cavernicola]
MPPQAPDPTHTGLPRAHVFITALAAVCAINRPPPGVVWDAGQWLVALLKLLDLDREALPTDVPPEDVAKVAAERDSWSINEQDAMARALVQAALAPQEGEGKPKVAYTPDARAAAHSTLELLGLDAGVLLPRAEVALATMLAAVANGDAVDEARKKQRDGWGGALGRGLATAGGFLVGGVLLGVTGGLAAPAIVALLAPLGLGAALSGIAAPVVLGTLFGLTGGGLASRRVSQRWRGIDEFSFVEVGANSKPTKDEIDDMKVRGAKSEEPEEPESELLFQAPEDDDAAARREVTRSRRELRDRLQQLSINAGTDKKEVAKTPPDTPDVRAELKDKMPSLTATIVVPGLLTISRMEAISAWRSICSREASLPFTPRKPVEPAGEGGEGATTGLKDGRDVYVLRYETEIMLSTGRDLESWVMTKVKSIAATEVVKRTMLSAYYLAIALPLSVYKLSTLALDNSFTSCQNKSIKAGRLLGEVLAQRVQGERPVSLIGTSVGALTVLHALLYLSEQDQPHLIDSVFLVSLPSAPTTAEWSAVRSVTARRVVNAWCGSDFVLASVVRLHEVLSRGVTGKNGVCVAGLGPVQQPGVEDMDLSDVLDGHSEINTKMGEVLQVLEIDD